MSADPDEMPFLQHFIWIFSILIAKVLLSFWVTVEAEPREYVIHM